MQAAYEPFTANLTVGNVNTSNVIVPLQEAVMLECSDVFFP